MKRLGVVVIGRNEGERLQRCLASITHLAAKRVYVDSGSTDGSTALARKMGVEVVELDMSIPFTAARARNAGFERLCELDADLEWVQFVDGDCEVVPGWLERALRCFQENPKAAAVCGRVRERFREQTLYNRLCDIEWDTPPGEVKSCGGNAMMQIAAFRESGGFNPTLIAGEEPELCVRLRIKGHLILRVDTDMVFHDAAMTRFSQWWRRAVRAGHAYAEGARLHGKGTERHWVRECRSIRVWGIFLPLISLALVWPSHGASLLLFLLYPLLVARIWRRTKERLGARDARLYAFFCVLSKFPQAVGQLQFSMSQLFGKRRAIIDWRDAGKGSSGLSAAP